MLETLTKGDKKPDAVPSGHLSPEAETIAAKVGGLV
jgi:hypothetical protein